MKLRKLLVLIALAGILLAAYLVIPTSALEPVHNASDEYLISEYNANLRSVVSTGDQRTDVVLVALSQLGYHEGDSDADMGGKNASGKKNFVEYNRLFGKVDNNEGNGVSYGYEWCCAFTTWCVRQAGVPVSVVKTEISCPRLLTWVKANSTFKTRESGYIPLSGDLVFFKNAGSAATSTHIGIVRYVSGATVYTVEGNTTESGYSGVGNYVSLKSYDLTSTYIVGYCVPAYVSNTTAALDFSKNTTGTYYITTSSLNVRSGASTNYASIGYVSYGDKVTVSEVSAGWGKIKHANGDGWIYLGYAQYVPSARYTIYYNANGGTTVIPSQPKPDGAAAVLTSTVPSRSGYKFVGWTTTKSSTTAEYRSGDSFTKNENTTLYAVWAVGEYTVSFYNDEKTIQTGAYPHGAIVAQPAAPLKAPDNTYKYIFAGWDTNSDGKVDVKAGENVTATGDIRCHAVYDKAYVDYRVVFVGRDGKVIAEKNYHYGDAVDIPQVPDVVDGKYRYIFNGWESTVAATVTQAAEYKAQYRFETAKYKVSFLDGDGKLIHEQDYFYEETVTLPTAVPTKSADETYTYVFSKWDKEAGPVKGNTTYTALFDGVYIEYKVRFIDGDGNTVEEKKCHYGDIPALSADKTALKASDLMYDYSFTGWDKELSKVTGDTDYTAQYESKKRVYTVTFFNEDGTVYKTASYNYGDVIALPESPVKNTAEGAYIFGGWTPEVTPVTGNMNFTATFRLDPSVTTKAVGGTDSGCKLISVGTVISLAVVLLAAAGFVTFMIIRNKRLNGALGHQDSADSGNNDDSNDSNDNSDK